MLDLVRNPEEGFSRHGSLGFIPLSMYVQKIPGPKAVKLFSCSAQLRLKFQLHLDP